MGSGLFALYGNYPVHCCWSTLSLYYLRVSSPLQTYPLPPSGYPKDQRSIVLESEKGTRDAKDTSKDMTLKQKQVAKDLLENVGKPIGKAMLDAGYSPATAKNPDHLTESKGWAELMEKYLPDDKVLEAHQAGLEATKTSNAAILLNKNGETIKAEEQGLIEVPDHPTRLKAVELAYKVKRKMTEAPIAPPNLGGIGNAIIFVNFKNETES